MQLNMGQHQNLWLENIIKCDKSNHLAKEIHVDSYGNALCEDPAEKVIFFFEEAEDKPMESVVYFRSGRLQQIYIYYVTHRSW